MEKIGKRFHGKVAVVTASTQGIGFSIAERLGSEGASVVVSSRKQTNVDEAVKKLKAQGIETMGVVCHVSNPQHRKNLIEKAVEKYGAIDVFVSNAAVNPDTGSTILSTQEWVLDKLWEVNVKSSVLLIQEAAPHLRKGSSIVLMSSVAGFLPRPSVALYGVTKTAIFSLTKALAEEMGPDIRVNCVAPGVVPTQFAAFIMDSVDLRKQVLEQTRLKKFGTTEDVAAATAFLASDDAAYITGETLLVTGGIPCRL